MKEYKALKGIFVLFEVFFKLFPSVLAGKLEYLLKGVRIFFFFFLSHANFQNTGIGW